jgi:hypothetical protein
LIRIAFCQTNHLFILLERAEKEIRFSMANGTFKIKMDIDRHALKKISVMHVIKLGFAPVSFPPG